MRKIFRKHSRVRVFSIELVFNQIKLWSTAPAFWAMLLGVFCLSLAVAKGWRLEYDLYQDRLVLINLLNIEKTVKVPPSASRVGWQALCMVLIPDPNDKELALELFRAKLLAYYNGSPWAGAVCAPLADRAVRDLLAKRLTVQLGAKYLLSSEEVVKLVDAGCDFVLNDLYGYLAKPHSPPAARRRSSCSFFYA